MSNIIVPSNPADREKIDKMLDEMSTVLEKISFERETLKDAAKSVAEEFDIPLKLVNKLAKTRHKRNYEDVVEENNDFETLYESITKVGND